MAKLNAKDFIASLNEMSLLEIKELVDAMKEEYGIDPTAVAVAAGPVAGAEAADDNATVTVTVLGPSSSAAAAATGAATATELGSTPNSSFIASTNSLISNRLISFKLSIKLSFVNLAILNFLP